ncbi:MAG: HAMP domain-containing sensor histidine kinase, partial [Patescibacteria group bacterium]
IIEVGLIFLLAIMVVIFIASITSNSVLRPLQRLLELTRLVGVGKLQYRLKVTTNDEIGELTEAFNAMLEKLQEQQSRERLIAQLKSEFISIAAHQLRTPLSAFKWTFRMIIDGDVGPITSQQAEFLERGYQINEHMIKLVNDLLNAARIEEGRFGYVFTPMDYIEYIKQFIDRYKQEADAAQMIVKFNLPDQPIPFLNIDTGKIDIVIQNLLDNALKYSNMGGTIQVSISINGEFVETTVSDNGVGIPQGQLNRVFTKFFRGDNVVRMETQGTGLGLFIVSNIVKNHGGTIRVESEENKGSKFIFALPINKELIPKKEERFEEFLTNL